MSDALPTLLAASHWRIDGAIGGADATARTALLGRAAGLQAAALQADTGVADAHAVCSTVLSGLCPSAVCRHTLLDGMQQAGIARPAMLLRAYECSGWGFALRFHALHGDARRVLISIVDGDVHDSSMFHPEGAWGRSGFGTTALLLGLPGGPLQALSIGRSDRRPGTWGSDTRSFANLVQQVRQRLQRPELAMIFVHFMVRHIRGALEHVVGTTRISANRFESYGHCFGADPWIGLIEWARAAPPAEPVAVTAASLSNNGYYTLCDVRVTPHTRLELRTLRGDSLAALRPDAPARSAAPAFPPRHVLETA